MKNDSHHNLPRTAVISAIVILILAACSALNPSPREKELKDLERGIIETDTRTVDQCRYLGAVSGTADPRFFPEIYAVAKCKERARLHAAEIGATHIVWLYSHPSTAAALAYNCDDASD